MAAPFQNTSLYVGNLRPDVTENDLFLHFSAVGPLHSTRVCRDAITRMSLKYGYVNFQSQADAESAIENLNYSPILGQPCRLMRSQRDPSLRRSGAGNVFIKNLEKSIDEKILYDTFSMFGTILSCKIETDEAGKSRGFGYVHYETLESAEAAINQVNGKMINGLIVYVGNFISKKQPSEVRFNNVYVKNLDESIDSAKLGELFSKFGPIISPFVVTNVADGKSRGFGFVSFQKHEDAVKAIEEMNGVELCGKSIYCTRALKKGEPIYPSNPDALNKGTNLYVKYLDDDVDDVKLTDAFKTYGPISSAVIMRGPDGRSRGFGFVCFQSAEDAERALREMHNKLVWSRPLYVSRAQRKDERRAFLQSVQSTRGQRLDGPYFGPAGGMYPANLYYGGMPHRPVYSYPPVRYAPGMGSVPMGGPGAPGRGPAANSTQAPGALNPAAAGRPGHGQGNPYYANPAAAAGGHHQSFHAQGRGRPLRNPNYAAGAPGYSAPRAGPGGNPMPYAGQTSVGPRVRNAPSNSAPINASAPVPNASRFQFGTSAPSYARAAAGALNRGPAPGSSPQAGLQQLSQIPTEEQRRVLGDAIFHRVSASYPQLATRITGMILEMDTSEVVSLLDTPGALTNKVEEAKNILEEYSLGAGPADQFATAQHGVPIANSS